MRPHTPVSPSVTWRGGQELTNSELISLQKAKNRLIWGFITLATGFVVVLSLLVSQIQQERPLTRIKFHQNEVLKLKANYLSGLRHGLWQRWYENGALMEEGYFFRGRPDGCWVHYFASGQVAKRACYDKGLYEGHVISYRSNGMIRFNQYYQKGKMTPIVPFHHILIAHR